MNSPRILFFCAALAMLPVALAQNGLSARVWQNDLDIIHERILQPLRHDFEAYQFSPTWRVYRDAFLEGIREQRGLLHQSSYQIMRDIMLTLSQDFDGMFEDGSWSHAEHYLQTKLDLTGNILALTEDGF